MILKPSWIKTLRVFTIVGSKTRHENVLVN
jgi:hypothetical protein